MTFLWVERSVNIEMKGSGIETRKQTKGSSDEQIANELNIFPVGKHFLNIKTEVSLIKNRNRTERVYVNTTGLCKN